jgi:hypothetical protein
LPYRIDYCPASSHDQRKINKLGTLRRHDQRKNSVSLATIELKPTQSGTKITVTEQGAFLDGYEDCGSREQGTADLLTRLGASLTGA